MTPPEIFDRDARRLRRDRAARLPHDARFLIDHIRQGVAERVEDAAREFAHALDLGSGDARHAWPAEHVRRIEAGGAWARAAGAVHGDEDRTPPGKAAFDLIVSGGVLDTVNDLPGALLLARRALQPGGLFVAGFIGAGSLPRLRAAMRAADSDHPRPRIHPQIDVRAGGDLLSRAGFARPVADTERLDVRYRSLDALVADLRAMAGTNLLAARSPLTRGAWERARAAFASHADAAGRVTERVEIVYLTGHADDAAPMASGGRNFARVAR